MRGSQCFRGRRNAPTTRKTNWEPRNRGFQCFHGCRNAPLPLAKHHANRGFQCLHRRRNAPLPFVRQVGDRADAIPNVRTGYTLSGSWFPTLPGGKLIPHPPRGEKYWVTIFTTYLVGMCNDFQNFLDTIPPPSWGRRKSFPPPSWGETKSIPPSSWGGPKSIPPPLQNL